MPNYVFLILRKFHLILLKVLKTSFKQKENRITLLPSNISERSQLIKSRVYYLIRKDKSWKRNQKLRQTWGFHWSQQGPAGFTTGKPSTHRWSETDFGRSQDALAEVNLQVPRWFLAQGQRPRANSALLWPAGKWHSPRLPTRTFPGTGTGALHHWQLQNNPRAGKLMYSTHKPPCVTQQFLAWQIPSIKAVNTGIRT